MSREIKFRAWDKDEQEYCYNAEQTYDYLCSRRGCMAQSFGDVLDQPGRYIVEQYTGLKDKNGKEIYEGDIVRCYSRKKLLGEYQVIWNEDCSGFECESLKPLVDGGDRMLKDVRVFNEKSIQFRVIGNIHEPPKDFRPEHLKRMGVTIVKGSEE